ncbi:2-hydroxymuconate tautomerase [Acidocella sp.]|uniref:2-hydroxymuconate tautomerase n=1 Tax=Acidocella sp. TaxID=50710 RepID=UPI00261DD6FA|nr:2-hydroxymuconate tautomerase [Acidocella sp.]
MPIVNVTMIEGRSFELKQKLIRAMTDAIVESINAPRDSIRIILNEVPPWHFAAGGEVKGKPPEAGE